MLGFSLKPSYPTWNMTSTSQRWRGYAAPGGDLTQLLSNFLQENDGNLCPVISGILKQEGEDLQSKNLMGNLA